MIFEKNKTKEMDKNKNENKTENKNENKNDNENENNNENVTGSDETNSIGSASGKDDEVCSECGKSFIGFGHNSANVARHVQACLKKKGRVISPKKPGKKRPAQSSILKFLSKKTKTTEKESDVESDHESEGISKQNDQSQVDFNREQHEQEIIDSTVGENALFDDNELVCKVSSVNVSVSTEKLVHCDGYIPALIGDVFENFPLHLLNDSDIVFENGRFHGKLCAENNYLLFDSESDESKKNPCCLEIQSNEKFQKIVTDSNDTKRHLSTVNNKFLSHNQLTNRVGNLNTNLRLERMKSLNRERKLNHIHKTLNLHQRFMLLIKENNIPKLHELVKVALSRKRGLEYVINKMVDAIDGIYNPNSSSDDKDLAFVILQYGGPGLLDIVHRALNFPSSSTAYKFLQTSKSFIRSSICQAKSEFVDNIKLNENNPKYGYMLKIDETFTEKKVRWNPKDNMVYGLCYEHGRFENLKFESYEVIEGLSNEVKQGFVHVPKETMAIVCSSNSSNAKAQVVAALPTCSKKETEYQTDLIQNISTSFFNKTGAPFLNWSTDGDPTRRIIFDSLMSNPLSPSSSIYEIISRLRLIDMYVGKHEETVNFDVKHESKRLRNFISSNNFRVGSLTLLRSDVKKILSIVPNSTTHSNESLLNPKDKQNVPLATALLQQYCLAVEDVTKLKTVSFKVSNVAEELHLFKYVIEGVLVVYTRPNISIEEQLEKISLAAHILFVIQRTVKTFIPNQLYHDIQATFEDAYFCAAKWKVHHPNLPLFLMLCSNDVIERFFGNLRLKYKHSTLDNLEIIYASRSLELLSDMMVKHPDWYKKNRNVMQRLCLDYSSPQEWDAEKLILNDVDIVNIWNIGRASAEQKLNRFKKFQGENSDFFKLSSEGFTLLKPYGKKKLGLSDEVDISQDDQTMNENSDVAVNDGEVDVEVDVEEQTELEDIPSVSIIDMVPQNQNEKHDSQVEVDGSFVYKATVVKNLFSSNPLSKDRLRRIRGMTKYTEGDKSSEAIETSIMTGDPILVNIKGTLKLAKIDTVRKSNKKAKMIDSNNLSDKNVTLDVHLMAMDTLEESYVWNGSLVGEKLTVQGTNCFAIQPTLKEVEGVTTFCFDKQLILDLNVGVRLETQKNANSTTSTTPSTASKNNLVKCHICKKNIDLKNMRRHIGKHVLQGTISGYNICGFCGRDACENKLVKTSSKGKTDYFKVQSNCQYFFEWKKTPAFSNRNPCSNHIVHCIKCKASIWTYNTNQHFAAVHPDIEIPLLVSEEEIKKMKTIKE